MEPYTTRSRLEPRMRWRQVSIAGILCLGLLISHVGENGAQSANEERRCLAMTLYWEARAGGRDAMVPVGWVVLNRRNHPEFPDTICGVMRDGGENSMCQFSFWCDGKPDVPQNKNAWKLAREVAADMLRSPPKDPTHGALYFHSADLSRPWKKQRQRTARVGDHVFYR